MAAEVFDPEGAPDGEEAPSSPPDEPCGPLTPPRPVGIPPRSRGPARRPALFDGANGVQHVLCVGIFETIELEAARSAFCSLNVELLGELNDAFMHALRSSRHQQIVAAIDGRAVKMLGRHRIDRLFHQPIHALEHQRAGMYRRASAG